MDNSDLSVGHNSEPYKTAGPVEMPFRAWTWMAQKNKYCVIGGARFSPGSIVGATPPDPFCTMHLQTKFIAIGDIFKHDA